MKELEIMYWTEVGYYPESEEEGERIQDIISYLCEAGINQKDIIKVIEKDISKDPKKVSFDDLPERLWENSLLEKGRFYYHRELRMRNKMPKLSKDMKNISVGDMKIEMKIIYTMDELLNYYYKKANIFMEIRDHKKDRGALNHLLKKYEKITSIEAIDFVLTMIDICNNEEIQINEVFDIEQKKGEAFNMIKQRQNEARAKGLNKIIWREVK